MKKIIVTLLLILLLVPTPVHALSDGAYLVSRTTSYVNPLTGKTEDGGSNIALGDSMVSNIVQNQLMIEQTGGKYYLTIGLGLASNVKNVRFKMMNSQGTFTSVGSTVTGSSSANGDTVNHYRIQVNSLDDYISPILYVTPMARDVQFFIKLNVGSASPGTGIYQSQMIVSSHPLAEAQTQTASSVQTNTQTSTKKEQETSTTQDENTEEQEDNHQTVGTLSKDELLSDKGLNNYLFDQKGKYNKNLKLTQKNLLKKDESQSSTFSYTWLVVLGIVILMSIGGILYVKKIKK